MYIERPGSPSATTVAPGSKRRSTSIEIRRSRLASERPPKKAVAARNAFTSGELTAIDPNILLLPELDSTSSPAGRHDPGLRTSLLGGSDDPHRAGCRLLPAGLGRGRPISRAAQGDPVGKHAFL